jgi:hypothetical protein
MLIIILTGWDVENTGEFISYFLLRAILCVMIFLALIFGLVYLSFVFRRKTEKAESKKGNDKK